MKTPLILKLDNYILRKFRNSFENIIYKEVMNEKQKYGLGSGYLGMHRNSDFNKEYESIIKEKRRLKIG